MNTASTDWAHKVGAASKAVSLHDLPDSPQAQTAVALMKAQGVEKLTITRENIDRYLPLLQKAYEESYIKLFTDPTEREPFERWVSDIKAGFDIPNVRVITLFGKHFDSDAPEVTSIAASELYRLNDGTMCMFPNYYFSTERAQRADIPERDARSQINPPIPAMLMSQLSDARDMAEQDGRRISSLFFEAEDPKKTAEAGVDGSDQRMITARNRLYEVMLKNFEVPHFKIPHYVQQPLEEGADPCTVLTGRFVGSASQARSFIDQFQLSFTERNLDENTTREPEVYGPMRDGLDAMIAKGEHAAEATFKPLRTNPLAGAYKG